MQNVRNVFSIASFTSVGFLLVLCSYVDNDNVRNLFSSVIDTPLISFLIPNV